MFLSLPCVLHSLSARSLRSSRSRFRGLLPALALSLLAGAALTGCEDNSSGLEPIEIGNLVNDPDVIRIRRSDENLTYSDPASIAAQSKVMDDLVPGARSAGGSALGPDGLDLSSMDFAERRGEDADYIDKTDLFWKLNWIRKALQSGPIPTNLEEVVTKVREELEKTTHDKPYEIADQALQHLEEGIEHLRAHRTLRVARNGGKLIPWGLGLDAVNRYVDSGSLGFGGRKADAKEAARSKSQSDNPRDLMRLPSLSTRTSLSTNPTRAQQECIDTIRTYATRYRRAPQEMMQRAWRDAIDKIIEFGEELRSHPSAKRHPALWNKGDYDTNSAGPSVAASAGEEASSLTNADRNEAASYSEALDMRAPRVDLNSENLGDLDAYTRPAPK